MTDNLLFFDFISNSRYNMVLVGISGSISVKYWILPFAFLLAVISLFFIFFILNGLKTRGSFPLVISWLDNLFLLT